MLSDLLFEEPPKKYIKKPDYSKYEQESYLYKGTVILFSGLKYVFKPILKGVFTGKRTYKDKVAIAQDKDGNSHFIPIKDLFSHLIILAGTGMGKSGFFISTACQLNQLGKQLLVVDMKGETVWKLYQRLPKIELVEAYKLKKIVGDKTFYLGINPLFTLSEEEVMEKVSQVKNLFFGDSIASNNYNIVNEAENLLTDGVEFALAYVRYLSRQGKYTQTQIAQILKDRQLTLNDLAFCTYSEAGFERFRELMIKVYTGYKNEVVERWEGYNFKKLRYLPNVTGRIKSLLSIRANQCIFEANCFELDMLKTDKTVLIDFSGFDSGDENVDEVVKKSIGKLYFSSIFNKVAQDYYRKGKPSKELFFMVDEAGYFSLSNLKDIISLARSMTLSLCLFAQREDQFDRGAIGAFETVKNKFQMLEERELFQDRTEVIEGKKVTRTVKLGRTLDMPSEVKNRSLNLIGGIEDKILLSKIKQKREDIYKYFIN